MLKMIPWAISAVSIFIVNALLWESFHGYALHYATEKEIRHMNWLHRGLLTLVCVCIFMAIKSLFR